MSPCQNSLSLIFVFSQLYFGKKFMLIYLVTLEFFSLSLYAICCCENGRTKSPWKKKLFFKTEYKNMKKCFRSLASKCIKPFHSMSPCQNSLSLIFVFSHLYFGKKFMLIYLVTLEFFSLSLYAICCCENGRTKSRLENFSASKTFKFPLFKKV